MHASLPRAPRLAIVLNFAIVATTLTACGGGDSSTAVVTANADPADSYAGSWTSDCLPYSPTSGSYRYYWHFSKTGAETLSGSATYIRWRNTTCTEDRSATSLKNFAAVMEGKTAVSGKTADVMTVSYSGSTTLRLYFSIEGSTLYSSLYPPTDPTAINASTGLYLRHPFYRQ